MNFPFRPLRIYVLLICVTTVSYFQTNAQTQDSIQVFVSPNGNDGSNGSAQQPVLSLKRALDIAFSKPLSSVSILMKEGVYNVQKTIECRNKLKPSIRVIGLGGQVTLTGGALATDKQLSVLSSSDAISMRIPESAKKHILVGTLSLLGVQNYGGETLAGFGLPDQIAPSQIFWNGVPLTLARWPNQGFLRISNVPNRGSRAARTPTIFNYETSDRNIKLPSRSLWIAGIFGTGWAFDNIPVDSLDTIQRKIQISESPSYGVYTSDDQSTPPIKQAQGVRGFYFYNAPELLDTAGEYYVDTASGKIYIYPPDIHTPSEIAITDITGPIISISNLSNIEFENLIFRGSRANLLVADKTNNLSFKNCHFVESGESGVQIGNATGTNIENCQFKYTGGYGVNMAGGDRKAFSSSNNQVSHCEFEYCGFRRHSYYPALNIAGIGIRITGCYFHHAESQAIIFTGNDHLIENNVFDSLVTRFNDMGAVYTDRDPLSAGTIIRNNLFMNIGNQKGMTAAIYLDDGSSGISIQSNLFYRCGNILGAIHINGGTGNSLSNNTFISCNHGVTNSQLDSQQWQGVMANSRTRNPGIFDSAKVHQSLFRKHYPYLNAMFDTAPNAGTQNQLINSVFAGCTEDYRGKSLQIQNTFDTKDPKLFGQRKGNNWSKILWPPDVQNWPNWTGFEPEKISPI